jgi:hypothetical protein
MARGHASFRPCFETLENRLLLATYTVTNTANGGAGSLRRAIADANQNNGPDVIVFNIPGAGVHTIAPTAALPDITDPVTIDGYTQPGASANTLATGNNAVLRIELNGANVGGSQSLLWLQNVDDCVIRGLALNRAVGNAILVTDGSDHLIEGNFIGTNVTGTTALANTYNGIAVVDSTGVTIGGATPASRNVISASDNGVYLVGASATANTIQGNYIGTNSSGTQALPNAFNGIYISASNNLVGGTSVGAGNLISGNGYHGVHLSGIQPDTQQSVPTTGNQILGNRIGTNVAGTGPLGNGPVGGIFGRGLFISDGAFLNTVGGTAAGAANVIAYNHGDGVLVGYQNTLCPPHTGCTPAANGNAILRNSIFANASLAIDLGANVGGPTDGVSPNDPTDTDAGPNNMQNLPTITAVVSAGATTKVSLMLSSTPNTTFTLEVFRNVLCDPSRHGEGETFLGSALLTTDSSGTGSAFVVFGVPVAPGHAITATATSPGNDTSEFSRCRPVLTRTPLTVTLPPLPPGLLANQTFNTPAPSHDLRERIGVVPIDTIPLDQPAANNSYRTIVRKRLPNASDMKFVRALELVQLFVPPDGQGAG